MSQRPKFWMHRTARFWWGLLMLLLLQGAWLFAAYRGATLTCYGGPGSHSRFAILYGGAEFYIFQPEAGWSKPRNWYFQREYQSGIRLEPVFTSDTIYSTASAWKIFLPGWIPVLIWLIWWPLWMRRGDKVEDSIAAKSHQGPA